MLDTRDLQTEREELQQTILDSFLEEFPQYEDMTKTFENIRFEEEEIQSWKDGWHTELEVIEAVNDLENEVVSEWEYGVTLIEEDEFEDFVEQDLEDCGYISKDFPKWIEIDWEATANNVRQDYSEVVYNEITYLYR